MRPTNKEQTFSQLKNLSVELRKTILRTIAKAGSGHSGGSLGVTDLLIVLYEKILAHRPKEPRWQGRDRFILSAGHLCPALYTVLAQQGYYPEKKLSTLRQYKSPLQGHPEYGSLPGIENSSGPLGQGYVFGIGKALYARKNNKKWKTYVLSSDGEHDEGAVWEAAQLAAHHELDNLCVIIDRNNIQIGGKTSDVMDLRDLKKKYQSFGWNVIEIDGHNYHLIHDALHYFKIHKSKKPFCIIAHTTLGKGVSFMQDNPIWHGKAPNEEELAQALKELERNTHHHELHAKLRKKGVLP
jgi:transketolase